MIKHHVENDSVWVGLSRCSSITHKQSESYSRMLSSAELARNQRYRFARDRHRDLVARALLRSSLGGLLDTRPEDVEFEIFPKTQCLRVWRVPWGIIFSNRENGVFVDPPL